ncbi:filamentous hemagglutinin [Burkholderia sp. BCC0405]|uniref:two-partner secretion domain-containing protein n=1 Tax=Burkholderia sp. BCC0405 TaxID=2676298 RepID=UPI001FC82C91|nr:filamentous hemagglutinin [Burkholderia sp. BCC0405]
MRCIAAVMIAVMYFAPAVFLADEVAHAAPIVDPHAPIPFQPTVTQSSAGVPVINIPAPNAQGISASQFQSLSAGPAGLIFNNSLYSGTSLIGGQVGANPNLAGRTASVILAQVTSTGSQYASVLGGPLEIFGNSASLIIANPNGISVPGGTALTNISNLTLTTGTPQFLTGVGGTPTSFANAGAVAYNVSGGNITIDGPPGNDGTPGAGIAGTVGNLDVIAQTINVNAPLNANQRVNIITGNQLVSPTASGSTGVTYGTASNGLPNNATAIPTANGLAIDASQYGSVTSGQIYIIQNAAGLGANMQGPLSATAGNVVVQANGDVSVGQTFASQNVNLASAGNTTLAGTGLANQNYTVTASGDISAPGAVSAGQNVTMTAGGNLSAASVSANGNASLNAGNSMTVGAVSGQNLALTTGTGDLTVNSSLSAPGTIAASAGRDLTVNGAVQGGSTVALAGARNATVNGSVSSVGDASVTATSGSAAVNGNLQSNGAATVTAGQNATIGGTVQAQGPVTIAAQSGSITGQGNVASSQGAVSLNAGQAIALNGAVQSGSTVNATAGTNASFGGTVSAPGAVTIQAGQDTTLGGNVTSGGALNVTSGGNTSVQGTAASVGNMTLAANGGTLSTTGNVVSLGTLNASGSHGVSLGGTVYSAGNASIGSSAGSVSVAGAVSTPGTVNINAGQDATVAGTLQSGQTATITAARDANLNGGLEVDGTGNASVTAGRNINGTGAINVANDTSLNAGNNVTVSGAIQTGNNLSAIAGQNLALGATTAVGTSTLTATNGSAMLAGDALSGGATTITAGTDVNTQGKVTSLGDLAVNAKAGNLTAAGPVSTAGNASLNAGQNLTLNSQTTASKNANLTATDITTQGLAVGGNLTATAANTLDTSAGQLNQTFNASAPALSVGGNATLSGANVTTANAVVGGTTQITGTQSLTTGGTAAFKGDATLAGGTIDNVGTQMAAGNLNVSGSTVSNSGSLSSLQTANVTATNLNNSGTIYAPTTNLTVSGATTNSGGLLATNALNLTTGSLSNGNGLIFSGDVNHPTAAVGNTTVTVTGGNGSFDNTNGKILAQNVATLNLPNQTLDPSAASYGTVNGGNGLNLSAQSVNNAGTWTLPGTAVTVSAANGINNAGTINQGTGSLTLNGAVGNSGTVNGNDLTINGSLANQASGTVTANDAFTLNGSGSNAGTVQAANTLTISGTSYDNSNGTTRAGNSSSAAGSGNLSVNLSGNLDNGGGTLTATNDVSITAAAVNNSAASSTTNTTTTTKTILNTPLLMSTVIGTETVYGITDIGPDGGYLTLVSTTVPATLGGVLSVTGIVPPLTSGWSDGANYTNIGVGYIGVSGPQSAPVATSGTVQYVQVPTLVGYNSHDTPMSSNLWYVQGGSVPTNDGDGTVYPVTTLTIPTVTETTTTTGAVAGNSVIAAGHDLNLTANSLNNQSGTVSAGHDVNLNVQSLSNGGSSASSTVTDTVDTASLTAFMNGLLSMQKSGGGVSVWGSGNAGGAYGCTNGGGDNGQFCAAGPSTPPTSFTFDSPSAVTVQSVTSSTTVQGATGQIVAGHDLNLSGGNLTNAGTLAAANDVHINASSFTNQGTNIGTMTTTAGCASGYSAGCSSLSTTNPNSQTYAYQQTNATVTAGNDVVIAAGSVSNTYGNLVAGRNVVIGGAGTTASDTSSAPIALTQAGSATNTSGAIEAGNDVSISAATLTNTIAAPVQIHQNYGSATPYTGCTYNCEAYVDVQSASPATITANHNVNLTAGTFGNTGSLVTALNNVTINASGSAASDNQYLYAYWSSGFTRYGTPYATWGCANNPSLCAQLYGSAYSASAPQDPAGLPDAVGLPDFVPGTIQAGNTLAVNSPTLTNTGNVIGQTVNLTGATLVNGLTNPNVYTPPPAVSGQVISLGPPAVPSTAQTTVNSAGLVTTLAGQPTSVTGAAGLPSNTPIGVQTVGKPVAPTVPTSNAPNGTTVKTISGETVQVSYLTNNPAADVVGSLSPAALIAALPANLQPGSVPFYYDPYTQAQQVEQAALEATGKSSFYSTPSATDSTSQASINNQDTAALYGAALQYAEQHNVALGTQLSQAQLAQINAPMLWYVEQTVPEPGCTATGNGACPTVQALMPEVLLPQNYAVVNADGEITGTNVALNYANSILNTGSVSAQNLTVNTGTLTDEQRSTNVGTIYNQVDEGVLQTTGTVVQQGGFMTAMNLSLNAQAIDQIDGALQVANADGSENTAATAAMLANLKSQLGGNFVQSSVSNNLQTTLIADDTGFDPLSIIGMVAAVVLSVELGPEMFAFYNGLIDPIMLAATSPLLGVLGSAAATALAAGTTALAATAADQLISTGSLNLKTTFETAGVTALTAGLTQGLLGPTGIANLGNGITQGTPAATLANLGNTAENIVGQSLIGAGVQNLIEGGSFGTALLNNVVNDAEAVANNAIGATSDALSPTNIAEHAALGCAAGAAIGTGCSSSAVGGAVGAVTSGALVNAAGGSNSLSDSQRAAIAGATTLAGGVAAGALGLNGTAAASAAQSEAINNGLSFKSIGNNPEHSAASAGEQEAFQDEGAKFTVSPLTGQEQVQDSEDQQSGANIGQTAGQATGAGVAAAVNPGVMGGGAPNTAAVHTAAQNLGVNLNAVTVNSNGVAQVTIGLTNSMSFTDVQTLVNYAGSLGATSVEVNSGYLANPKLDGLLQNFAQSGRSLYGGTVTMNPGSSGDYIITFPVGKK